MIAEFYTRFVAKNYQIGKTGKKKPISTKGTFLHFTVTHMCSLSRRQEAQISFLLSDEHQTVINARHGIQLEW